MDSTTLTLAVLAFGMVAAILYALKIVTDHARQSVEAVTRMAETNTQAVAASVKDAVHGIVEALALNSQGPPPPDLPAPLEGPSWDQTNVGGVDGPPWADWTSDEYPDAGRQDVGDPAIDAIPGIATPDLSGEEYDG